MLAPVAAIVDVTALTCAVVSGCPSAVTAARPVRLRLVSPVPREVEMVIPRS